MGCHTWFYKKLNISVEQAKEDALYICNAQIKWNQNYIDNPSLRRDWLNKNEGDEVFLRAINSFSRYKRFIEKNLFKSLHTLSQFYDYMLSEDEENGKFLEGLYCHSKITDSVYIYTKGLPHDVFRVGGYPEDELFSFEEVMYFCKRKNIEFSLDQLGRLNKFWNEYPDGMISFA